MQEPRKKGLANHLDPESCAGDREVAGEALTGAHVGQPLSSEITSIGVPTLYGEGEGNMKDGVKRESSRDAAESETLSMRGNSMRENRETSKAPSPVTGEGRPEKANSRTSGVNVFEESDDLVVPAKRANNVGQPATAESVEGRRSREGTVLQADHVPDTVPEPTGGWRPANGAPHSLQGQVHRTQAKSRMR
jgi:RNA-directed DNA polymerase